MNVAVIGASEDPEKYSHKAMLLLKEKGHHVFPVNPFLKEIQGISVYSSLQEVPEAVDTVSLYLRKEISDQVEEQILRKAPKRVIFNPGAENEVLAKKIKAAGIQTLNACTLVLLKTDQF